MHGRVLLRRAATAVRTRWADEDWTVCAVRKSILTTSNCLTILLSTAIVSSTVFSGETELIEPVRPYVRRVVQSFDSIPQSRQHALSEVADYIVNRIDSGQRAKLVFVCTHNSRRSHLSHIWCDTAATYFDVPQVETYSGGTEETACNIRTVRAMRRTGLSVVASTEGNNPIYLVQCSELRPPIRAYSKVYFADGNPTSEFAAMMCCASADEQCPMLEGADERFSLHYEDPKVADDTPAEPGRYDERSFEIAREMFFVMSEVSRRLATRAPAESGIHAGSP